MTERGDASAGRAGSTRSRRERGATLIEAAIALPVIMFLLFGTIEMGLLVRDYSSTNNGVRAGGRMSSVAGNDTTADQLTLARMAQETNGLSAGSIDYIIIWHASGPGTTVPAGCLSIANSLGTANTSSQGVSDGGTDAVGACNIYARPQSAGGAFARATAANSANYFGCTGPSDPLAGQRLDCRWPPRNRKAVISPRVLPTGTPESSRLTPDFVGIYMRVSHRSATGLLGGTVTVTDSSINLLEPSTFGVSS